MKLVVVDTNVWVSAFLNRKGFPAQIKDAWVRGEFDVAISLQLLREIREVLNRPRIKNKYGLTEDEIVQFIELLMLRSVITRITGQLKLCRDERDNMVLETAVEAGAEYLISRDDDVKGDSELAVQMRALGVAIITVSRFLQELKKQ